MTAHAAATQAFPRFFVPDALRAHVTVTVGEDAARHMRVLRLGPGSPVYLLDGQGARATGALRSLAKRSATVEVGQVEVFAAPPAIHALVPIADPIAGRGAHPGRGVWRRGVGAGV